MTKYTVVVTFKNKHEKTPDDRTWTLHSKSMEEARNTCLDQLREVKPDLQSVIDVWVEEA